MGTRIEFNMDSFSGYLNTLNEGMQATSARTLNNTVRQTRKDMIILTNKKFNIPIEGPVKSRGKQKPGAKSMVRAKKVGKATPIRNQQASIDVANRAMRVINFVDNQSVSIGGKRRKIKVTIMRGRKKAISRRFIATAGGGGGGAKIVLVRSKTEKSIRAFTKKDGSSGLRKAELLKRATGPTLFNLMDDNAINRDIAQFVERNWAKALDSQMSKLHRRASTGAG